MRISFYLLVAFFAACLALTTVAQAADPDGVTSSPASATADEETTSAPASQPTSSWFDKGRELSQPRQAPPTKDPRLVPWQDYSGNFWKRSALLGDWGGVRQQLMDKGIKFDASFIQVYQGNWSGGLKSADPYQGNVRYGLEIDTGAAGLWPGGMIVIRGETRYGESNNRNVGSLSPVDTLSLYPFPGEGTTCLTDMYIMQFVSPWLGFMAGKMSLRDENVFAHDETSQFLNTSFNFNPIMGTTVPLDLLGAGVILHPADWLTLTTLVYGNTNVANSSGFPEVWQDGIGIYQMLNVGIKPFDLPGHQRLSWTWTDKSLVSMDQRINPLTVTPQQIRRLYLASRHLPPRVKALAREYGRIQFENVLASLPANVQRSSGDWNVMYDFDQYLYVKPGTKDQGVGLFGRFGVGPGTVNPVEAFYSLGVGGKGMIPTRDNDTFGVGYYAISLSNELVSTFHQLPETLRPKLVGENGIELYYNIAITPWLHLTPDLQIIDPFLGRVNPTVVAGLRLKMDF